MAGSEEPTAEVLVLGAGIVGLATAHALREAGVRRVAVVDRGEPGGGSTSRATGGIRVQFGSEVLIRLSLHALEHWRRWDERYGGEVGYRAIGYLFLATTPEQMVEAARGVALQQSLGANVERVGQQELTRRLPGVRLDGVLGGTFGADDGVGDPAAAVASLHRACRRGGVRIDHGTGDASLVVESGRVTGVRTSLGLHPAEQVVVATGAWTAPVLEPLGVSLPIEPHHRQAYRAAWPDGLTREVPVVVDRGTGVYFRPDGERMLFGGGDPEGEPSWDAAYRPDDAPRILDLLAGRLPAMAEAEIAGGWAGLREMTPDHLGVLGRIEAVEGLWVAAGFSGHGFMHGPAIGEVVAALVTGAEPPVDVRALAPDRFDHPVEPDPYSF